MDLAGLSNILYLCAGKMMAIMKYPYELCS